jgi:hypothetical protein
MRRNSRTTWRIPALALAALAAAALAAAPAGAITNGQPTGSLYPNVGALVVPEDIGELPWIMGPAGNFCSGTLVAPAVVLTAGHCTEGARGAGIGSGEVRVTFDPVITGSSTFYSGTYYTHPLFGLPAWGGSHANPYDIAVIVLDEEPQGITPALLPPVGLLDALGPQGLRHQSFTPVGYGTLRTSKKAGPHAFEPNSVRHYGSQGFWSLQPAWLLLSMQPATGNSGTCYADSGGPHFLGATNTIVSITVTGDAMCRATDKTYRLDLPLVQDFLSGFGVPIPSS